MKRSIIAVFAFLFLSQCGFVSFAIAATDPIADFCASPTAKADAQAQKECQDLTNLQNSNAQIKSEKDSIQSQLDVINSQIAIAEQKIKVQNSIIASLTKDIGSKNTKIALLQDRINTEVDSVNGLIQRINEKDSVSVIGVLLGNKNLSDFYVEVDTINTLNRELTALIDAVRSDKAQNESEKETLQDRKDKENDTRAAIQSEEALISRKKAEQATLLAAKTADYNVAQKLLSDQKQKVAAIRARLFKFQDGEGIPFGDAYDFAVKASNKTGVRPALILGVLNQESSKDENGLFGTNIGSCYVKNITTGDGVGKNTGRPFEKIMYSATDTTRPSDTVAFLAITNRLGRDWMTTPVSCPPDPKGDGKYYSGRGFGGGMGATQFIPSTWELIKKKVGSALGMDADDVSPWNYEHAIMAAAVLLRDAGAKADSTYSTERNSACIYYSGAKCTPGRKPANVFYGDQVMAKAADFQDDIDLLLGK